MNRPLSISIVAGLLSCATYTYSQQTESFHLATYTVPVGWKKSGENSDAVAYAITNKTDGTWAQVIIYRSMASLGSPQRDFDSDWKNIVMTPFKTGEPDPGANEVNDGWHLISGTSYFDFNGAQAALGLSTISGYGIRVSIMIQTNTDTFQQEMETFLASISLAKPETDAAPVEVVTPQATHSDSQSPFPGTWTMSSSEQNAYLVNNGMNGYIKREYTFNTNGTYRFVMKIFRMYGNSLWLTQEEGTYVVIGDQLTVKPTNTVYEEWTKKDGVDQWGTLIKSQPGKLEPATYRFTTNYFSGIQETQLVLHIATPTDRDGPYNGGTAYNNAYLYGPVNPGHPLVELPLRK